MMARSLHLAYQLCPDRSDKIGQVAYEPDKEKG